MTAREDSTVPAAAPPRARTARGQATRARIVDAAADLMFARGVRGTSLDDVRDATGTSKSQLYHYFAGKDDLVRAVIARQVERVLAAQEPLLRDGDSAAGLRRWRDAVVTANRDHGGVGGCPLGSLASELADYSDEARHLLVQGFRSWQEQLAQCLRGMRDNGELAPETDPDLLAESAMAALQGGLLLSQTARSSRPLERGLDMVLDHVAAHAQDRVPATRRPEWPGCGRRSSS